MAENDYKEQDNPNGAAYAKLARVVSVSLKQNGLIKQITDTQTPWSLDDRSPEDLPLDGEQYEWDLSKYEESGVPIMHLYTSRQSVATNTKSEKNHRNTVGLQLPELIKLLRKK